MGCHLLQDGPAAEQAPGSKEKGLPLASWTSRHLSVSALSWSAATPELADCDVVLVSRTGAVINSISLVKSACEELQILI